MSSERFFHNKRSRTVRKRNHIKRKKIGFLFVFLVLIASVFLLYRFRIIPIISNIALSNAETVLQTAVSGEISAFLAENGDNYGDIIDYKYDGNGDLLSFSLNQKNANLLINDVTSVISNSAAVDELSVSVPLGMIFDDTFFNFVGPKLNFKMIMTTSSFIKLKSEFESQGINQTRHKILMEVNMPVELLIPGKKLESNIDTTFIVSDTVIIGKVPDICLQPVDLTL